MDQNNSNNQYQDEQEKQHYQQEGGYQQPPPEANYQQQQYAYGQPEANYQQQQQQQQQYAYGQPEVNYQQPNYQPPPETYQNLSETCYPPQYASTRDGKSNETNQYPQQNYQYMNQAYSQPILYSQPPVQIISPPPPPVVVIAPSYGPSATLITCPSCGYYGRSNLINAPAALFLSIAMIILIIGLFIWPVLILLILFIPLLFFPSLWMVEHRCQRCGHSLGTYNSRRRNYG